MAVTAVVFDVGETLVDETGECQRLADGAGVPRFTFMALVGVAIERGESPHRRVFEWLGLERPVSTGFTSKDLYPDAAPCVRALRERGLLVGAAGNMGSVNEELVRPYVDFVGSSERWGALKPTAEFFARVIAEVGRPPAEIAYVGDRVDNDVLPAKRAGMFAVHIRRGPWGYLQDPSGADARIDARAELRGVLP